MTRVLLTGATGFVGRHVLAPLAARGFDVHAVARTPPGSTDAVTWHQVDLLDRRATAEVLRELEPSHLLHLAWYAEHGKFWTAPENLDWVAASLDLLRSFHACGGQRAVVAGTCAEYDWSTDCCDGQTPLRPATLYGISKNALREVADAYARSVGMSFAWGRIFFTYGPGEQPTRVVAAVAQAFVAGEEVQCSPGEQIRDFLYVEDLASAFAALLDSAVVGALDLGSGDAITVRDILLRLERLAGSTDLVQFSEALRRDEPHRIVAACGRLRDEVEWQPTFGLDAGLTSTLEWWRGTATGPRPVS